MKKQLYIFCLLLIGFGLITYGCGLLTMMVYGHIIKPTETWYFSKGYDKKIISSNIKTEISDSSNISSRSIRLDRKDNDTIKSYWIDFDTTIHSENMVRIKIVDDKGYILRFLDGWLVPEPGNEIIYSSISFNEDKNGNIWVKLGNSEHRIYHAGDMMGMHHFDINSPKIIKQRPSFQMNWDGYNFEYSWITFEGIKDDFYSFYQYSYQGDLIDSFYVSKKHEDLKISDNHYIEYNEWNDDYQFNIINRGNIFYYEIHENPFGGFGQDLNITCLNPLLHSLQKNGYINACLSHVSFGEPIAAFDWIRNAAVLKIVNETVKSIEYSKFISKDEFQEKKYGIKGKNFVNYNLGYSLSDINDSLIYYFQNKSSPEYYKEFWSRRKNENIDTLVFKILNEIKNHYSNSSNNIDTQFINGTLKKIMTYDLTIQNIKNEEKAEIYLDYYNYLTKIGLNQSAYNLIFLNNETENIIIDRKKIYNNLMINKLPYIKNNKTYFLSENKPKWIVNE